MVIIANKIPRIPEYNISKLNFREVPNPGDDRVAMAAEVSLSAFNPYPVQLSIPELAFEILVPNCNVFDPYITVADAITSRIDVMPQADVLVDVRGVIQDLPESLIRVCPDSNWSPLDHLLKQYMNGEAATVFVRGKRQSPGDVPDWVGEIVSSFTVPVAFPGQTFDNMIRNFSLTDVHFTLPDPMAEPGDADGDPRVSGTIVVTAGLPAEMNFDINVTQVRATADVSYHGKKFGELNLEEWQAANSTRYRATDDIEATLKIQSRINNAPLKITDGDIFSDVIQALILGGTKVVLDIKAFVDVRISTVLGNLELKEVPAEGKVPVKRPY